MPSKYIKHPRPINTKYDCNVIYNRSEPRVFTPNDVCRIARYAAISSSEATVLAKVVSCTGYSWRLCRLIAFATAATTLLQALGEIGAVLAVGKALEKAYVLLTGAVAKVPQLRIILAAVVVAIIFLRGIVAAIGTMYATSSDILEVLADLRLICELTDSTDDESEGSNG